MTVNFRKILHLDLDAFYCSVEEQRDPVLRGKAFAVGGQPQERGVVSSCSYPARQFGVRSAMPTARALRLCPGLLIISGHHHLYSDISQRVMNLLNQISPLVEQISIDEAFIDVSDMPEPGEIIAKKIQESVLKDLELPCSLGVASNKLVAKIATDVGKASAHHSGPPQAITIVPCGKEAEFLSPLPVEAMWGVGPKTAVRLAELGIHTIGELAQVSATEMVRLFGKFGQDLAAHARGLDDRPVITTHQIKSISQEVTFAQDIGEADALQRTLFLLAEKVGKRLRQAQLCGATIRLKIRWPDFSSQTRQTTLKQPTDQGQVIYETGLKLFHQVWHKGQPVRLIGLGVGNLGAPIRQLSLWDLTSEGDPTISPEKIIHLQAAVDQIHERFGDRILKRGLAFKKEDNDD